VPRGVEEENCRPRIFNAKAKMMTAPAVSVSMPAMVTLPVASFSVPRGVEEENCRPRIFNAKAKMMTSPTVSVSTPGDVKLENSWQRVFDSKRNDTMSTLRAGSICPSRNLNDCTRLTPIEAYGANYAIEKNSIPTHFNATNIPIYKTATKREMPTTSSTGRKKRKPKKVVYDVENHPSVAPPAYFGDLHAPLASHLSPMLPSFYHPLSNFSNPHLHHLIAKSNQIPYVYSNPIHPPPVDIASLYALGLTSPLQNVPTPLSLSLQNQQLLHQRGNPVPMTNYHQPSHMPVTSGDILEDLIRSYNIVSAADIEQRAQQQQQEYHASKHDENGHR